MRIAPEMIRPELRLMGGVIRKVMPVFDEKGLRSANKMHRLFSEGRSFSLKVNCEQVWLDRPAAYAHIRWRNRAVP